MSIKTVMSITPLSSFSHALLHPQEPLPIFVKRPHSLKGSSLPEKRFAIYRNNVVLSLIEALKLRFPVVLRLVGEDFFKGLARAYLAQSPPHTPLLWQWGDDFASFIAAYLPAQDLVYLPDIARLEASITSIFHAQDLDSLTQEGFHAFLSLDFSALSFLFTPACALLESPHPIYQLWSMNQEGHTPYALDVHQPEQLLLYRLDYEVHLRLLTNEAFALLHALMQGVPFAKALEITAFPLETLPSFFHLLLETQILTASKTTS